MKNILLILTCTIIFWQCSDADCTVAPYNDQIVLEEGDIYSLIQGLKVPSSAEYAPLIVGDILFIEGIGFQDTDKIIFEGNNLSGKLTKIEAQILEKKYSGISMLLPELVGNVNVNLQRGDKLYEVGYMYTILKNELVSDSNYLHIAFIGQSLATGWEATQAITTQSIPNNYMWGNNVNVHYNTDNGLKPLVATKWVQGGEQPIVAAVNSFSLQWRQQVNPDQKFIASTSGEGGISIEQLSKRCTNGVTIETNLYKTTFLNHIEKLKTVATKEGKTINCPAIVFMQGEFNYSPHNNNLGMTSGTNATVNKNEYKALLLQLKNDMQNDIMKIYGQTKKPLFFIYQTAGHYISEKEMSINMAQVEFAQQNDDVVLLPPTYPTSDYNGGHLSTNGYRWYGEYIGKALSNTIINKQEYQPIYPTRFQIENKSLKIGFHVPTPPLVFDTWTTGLVHNYGFKLYLDNNEIEITNVKISEVEVVLTTDNALSGKVEVSYATHGTHGTGNLRDSDNNYTSLYTYFNDSNDNYRESYTPIDKSGTLIYGKAYPLQNWCVAFYKQVN